MFRIIVQSFLKACGCRWIFQRLPICKELHSATRFMMCRVPWNVNKATVQRWYYTCMCIHMLAPKTHNTHTASLIYFPHLQRKFWGRKVCLLIFSEWEMCLARGWKVVAIKFFCRWKVGILDDSHLRWFCERGHTEVSLNRLWQKS